MNDHAVRTQLQCSQALQDELLAAPDSQRFNIACLLLDVPTTTNTYHAHAQLQTHYSRDAPAPTAPMERVDADTLLGLTGNVGLQCGACKAYDTSYKMLATRSADEGMTAMCTCRQCHHQWTIRM